MKVKVRIGLGGELYALPVDLIAAFEQDVWTYGDLYVGNAPDQEVIDEAAQFRATYKEHELPSDEVLLRSEFRPKS